MKDFTAIELCAGAGGQALGLEQAGFEHAALVEIDSDCCNTLKKNRPRWNVIEKDIKEFTGKGFEDVDLLAGGLPCPPFSIAGKQLGHLDERNLFPEAIRLVSTMRPKTVMIENVRGIFDAVFEDYRNNFSSSIANLGYKTDWNLLNSIDYGVSQSRKRTVFIAYRKDLGRDFKWPAPSLLPPPTVGELLFDLMSEKGWLLSEKWKDNAKDLAPTIVGGSKKHGGPDLGPTRAKKTWASLGVDGRGISNDVPDKYFTGMPRLTIRMVARIQGFPDNWIFEGGKTAAYRQVGNAFPPPVAKAVALSLLELLSKTKARNKVAA